MNPAAHLRAKLTAPGALLVPGAYDALSARLIEAAGFPAIYVGGAGVSAAMIGAPDLGLLSFGEVLDQVRRIAGAVKTPLLVDADTGYGGVLNVRRTIIELERAGVAAIQIEDQVSPKRCGHLSGTRVIAAAEMAAKVATACAARRHPNTIIIARTDARASLGLDEAIRRGRLYAAAGADVIFVEAPRGDEETQRVAAEIAAPLLLNLGGAGVTPLRPVNDYAALGYKIVIHPGALQMAAIKAMQRVLAELNEHGVPNDANEQMVGFQERFELLGYRELTDWARSFDGPQSEP